MLLKCLDNFLLYFGIIILNHALKSAMHYCYLQSAYCQQKSELISDAITVLWHLIWILVPTPAALLLAQLSVNVPEKGVDDG